MLKPAELLALQESSISLTQQNCLVLVLWFCFGISTPPSVCTLVPQVLPLKFWIISRFAHLGKNAWVILMVSIKTKPLSKYKPQTLSEFGGSDYKPTELKIMCFEFLS